MTTKMYGSCSSNCYFSLESLVASAAGYAAPAGFRSYEIGRYEHSVTAQQMRQFSYSTTAAAYKTAASQDYRAEQQPLAFLNPDRPRTQLITAAGEISGLIREAFLKTTQKQLPESITITVAPRETLQQIHRQFFKPGVVGLSINSTGEIFVVSGSLDEVMLTIGHELGHVLTPLLPNEHSEEAKAFAFEMAWARAIFFHDIGGLRNSINQAALSMKPAVNGLHNLAFEFVKAAISLKGKEPLELHTQLASQKEETSFGSCFAATATVPATYTPLSSTRGGIGYTNYRNKSRVQNVPWMQNFTWADLGTGIYGMYIPLTASIFMNERLLRSDLEQFHKTLGHEYVLHHVMQLPDGYVAKAMEEQIFWTKEEKESYKP